VLEGFAHLFPLKRELDGRSKQGGKNVIMMSSKKSKEYTIHSKSTYIGYIHHVFFGSLGSYVDPSFFLSFKEYVACAISPSVTTFSTYFSFQNLVVWNLFESSVSKNHLKINISHISESKSYQINSIKSCSSRSFQQYQRHIPIPPKFSASI